MEGYQIIYTWKILEGIAPNVGIKSYPSTRQGRLCQVPEIKQCASGKIRAIREGSFQIREFTVFQQPSSKYPWPDRMLHDQDTQSKRTQTPSHL